MSLYKSENNSNSAKIFFGNLNLSSFKNNPIAIVLLLLLTLGLPIDAIRYHHLNPISALSYLSYLISLIYISSNDTIKKLNLIKFILFGSITAAYVLVVIGISQVSIEIPYVLYDIFLVTESLFSIILRNLLGDSTIINCAIYTGDFLITVTALMMLLNISKNFTHDSN